MDETDVDVLSNVLEKTAELEPTDAFVDSVMARVHASESASVDPEERLAQLFEATAAIAPTDAFQVSIPDHADAEERGDIDELFAKTASLSPTDGFTDEIMGRVAKAAPLAKPGFLEIVSRRSRTAFIAAAAVAAASVGFSIYSESSYDAHVVASVDLMEPGD
ncbi:MAG: hypothetical protein JNK04_00320 [Myxococcales bacterium]|nr:hypothetical protein [Myxococcales bacterium]